MNLIKYFFALLTLGMMTACTSMGGASMGGDSTVTEVTTKQLTGDVPLPPGALIKQQETLVMGSGNSWMGRVGLGVSGEPQTVFTYFRDGLPAAGWTLTSSSFSRLSLLTFSKAERVATVQIQGGSFGNNDVLITVAPAMRSATSRP